MIKGVSHITFVVRNLNRTAALFKEILDAEEVYDSGSERHSLYPEKFFLIGGQWIAVMQADNEVMNRTYHHVAFEVKATDIDKYRDRIVKAGLEIRPSRSRFAGEGESIYFYDFDNNLFELHTGTLEERLKAYKKDEA